MAGFEMKYKIEGLAVEVHACQQSVRNTSIDFHSGVHGGRMAKLLTVALRSCSDSPFLKQPPKALDHDSNTRLELKNPVMFAMRGCDKLAGRQPRERMC